MRAQTNQTQLGRSTKPLPIDPVAVAGFRGQVIEGEVLDEPRFEAGGAGTDSVRDLGADSGDAASSSGTGREPGAGRGRPFPDEATQAPEGQFDAETGSGAAHSAAPPRSEADQLADLRAETKAAGERYLQSLREAKIFAPGFTDDEREKKVSQLHMAYTSMMALTCLRPLINGVNTHAVVESVGTMTALWMLCPSFREQMQGYGEHVKNAVQTKIDARAHDELSLVGGDKSRLSSRWSKRLADAEFRERGHREPFTVESAAMTQVALAESAYDQMRTPDADMAAVLKSYESLIERIHAQIEDDGLDLTEVATATRMLIGHRMEAEPKLRVMFDGLGTGRYAKSEPEVVRVRGRDGEIRTGTRWLGGFEDLSGAALPDGEMFDLRQPMDADEHQVTIAETMAMRMRLSLATADLKGFGSDMTAYVMGYSTRDGSMAEGFDVSPLSRRTRVLLEQSHTMLEAMAADGISEVEQQRIYSNAFVDALEEVSEEFPELSAQWGRQYGDDWQSYMREAVVDPRLAYVDWVAHEQAQQSTSQSAHAGRPGTQREYASAAGPEAAGDPEPANEPDFA